MLKAIGFVVVVYLVLSFVGATPQHLVTVDGLPLTGWASSLLTVAAVLTTLFIVGALIVAVMIGAAVVAVGIPVLIIALVLCVFFAPVLAPLVLLMALALGLLSCLGSAFA